MGTMDMGRGSALSVDGGAGGSVRVLLVDDQPNLAETTALHLEQRRDTFDTVVANGGATALERLETTAVDCVVSDYDMPEMNGLDLLREVADRDRDLPFILFTGKGSEEIASKAISAGVTDYLQKQTTTDQYDVLANRIENAVARRRSEQARAETELRYRNLVDTSPDAILVLRDREILYANQTLCDLAGLDSLAAVYDASPLTFVHPDDRDEVAARMEDLQESGTGTGWVDWRLQRPDGELRHVESRGAPVTYAGDPAIQVVLRDVTERRRHERRLATLNDATRDLLLADSRAEIAREALTVVEEVLDEPLAVVLVPDEDRAGLVPLAGTQASAALLQQSDTADRRTDVVFGSDTVEWDVYRTGEPRVVQRYGDREHAITDVIETSFLFPLSDHGVLGIASTEPTSFDGWDRDLLDILGRSTIAAFDRLEE